MNCIRKEHGCSNARYCFIQDEGVERFTQNSAFFATQLNQQLTVNILQNGQWGSLRHLSLVNQNDIPFKPVENAFINTITRGDLKSTKWIESPLRYYQTEKFTNSNLVYIYYSGINFRLKIKQTKSLFFIATICLLSTETLC